MHWGCNLKQCQHLQRAEKLVRRPSPVAPRSFSTYAHPPGCSSSPGRTYTTIMSCHSHNANNTITAHSWLTFALPHSQLPKCRGGVCVKHIKRTWHFTDQRFHGDSARAGLDSRASINAVQSRHPITSKTMEFKSVQQNTRNRHIHKRANAEQKPPWHHWHCRKNLPLTECSWSWAHCLCPYHAAVQRTG
jgi:hypothetical protein